MKIDKFNNIIYIFILIFADFITLLLSLIITIYFSDLFLEDILILNSINKYYWVLLVTLLALVFEKIYFIRFDFWSDTKRILKALFFSFILVFIFITLVEMFDEYSKMFLLIFFLIASFLIPFIKRYFKKFLFYYFDIFKIRVKVIGKSVQYENIVKELNENWYFGFIPSNKKFNMVIISSKDFKIEQLQRKIRIYSKKTKDIYVIPYLYNLDFSSSNIVDYFNIRLSAIHLENKLLNIKNILIKYFFEKFITICIFPFALIIHCIIFLLIKLDSNGKVFFKQKRLGKNGKVFRVYKYRTMYENSDKILKEYLIDNPEEQEYYNIYHKYKNDPRVTKLGKILRITSLDEFPQFYNILRGDMNLIGPRPYMLEEMDKIGKFNENIILKVKPGITGLWQVSGRNELSFKQRIQLDRWYIQNWSLWMDFIIFTKTIKVVLSKVGAK